MIMVQTQLMALLFIHSLGEPALVGHADLDKVKCNYVVLSCTKVDISGVILHNT